MAFSSSTLFTILKSKVEKVYPDCMVGRYKTPKESQFPYLHFEISDRAGGNYDMSGNEGSITPLVVLTAYCSGSSADSTCEDISLTAKDIMLSYGFQCKFGPAKVINADAGISRWVARYTRVFGSDDKL